MNTFVSDSSRPAPRASRLQENRRPAVFLDRDGTLNVQVIRHGKPFAPVALEEFRLFDAVPRACKELHEAGFVLVVVTNQPDVGRGLLPQSAIEAMHARLLQLIPEIERIEVCYDSGLEPSRRRKPEPGMLLDSAAALQLDLRNSWMIGDRWRDVDCGKRAGVRTVFIDFGYAEKLHELPDFTAKSFAEAARIVLAHR